MKVPRGPSDEERACTQEEPGPGEQDFNKITIVIEIINMALTFLNTITMIGQSNTLRA